MAKKIKKVTTTVTEETILTNEKTQIVCVLDRSGSMATIIEDAIGGFNEFLSKQKELDDDATITVVLFDDRYEMLYDNVSVKEAKSLTRNEWSPRGTTALYDAIGKTINNVESSHKKMLNENLPDKVLFVIVTDGLENASREFKHDTIKSLISKKEKESNWKFLYLAADQDAFDVGTSFSVSGGNTFNYTNTSDGNKNMFNKLSSATKLYRTVSTTELNYSYMSNNLMDIADSNGTFNVKVDNDVDTKDTTAENK